MFSDAPAYVELMAMELVSSFALRTPVLRLGITSAVYSVCKNSFDLASLYWHGYILYYTAFQQYFVQQNLQGFSILKNEAKLPLSVYLGACGMPGMYQRFFWNGSMFSVNVFPLVLSCRLNRIYWLERVRNSQTGRYRVRYHRFRTGGLVSITSIN